MVQTFASLTGAELITRALLLATAIIIARVLAPGSFGEFAYAVALASIVGFVIDLGLTSMVTRDVSATPERAPELLGAFLRTQLILASLTFATTAGLALAGAFGGPASKEALVLAFAAISIGSLSRPFEATLTGRGKAHLLLAGRAARGAALVIGTVVASFGAASPERFLVALAIAECVGVVAVGLLCTTRSTRLVRGVRPRQVTRLLRLALPFALLAGFNVLYLRVDLLMLGQLDDQVTVGNYGIASRIMDAAIVVPAYFGGAFLATIAATGPRTSLARFQTFSAIRHLLLICVPLGFALGLAADPLVRLVAGAKYESAGTLLTLLSPMLVLIASYAVLSNLQVALDQVGLLVRINLVGLLVKIGLNAYAIPAHGAKGAAVCGVIAEAVVVAAQLWSARSHFDARAFGAYVLRLGACAVPMVVVGLGLFEVLPWAVAVAVSTAVFAAAALVARCTSLDEMRVAWSALAARPS